MPVATGTRYSTGSPPSRVPRKTRRIASAMVKLQFLFLRQVTLVSLGEYFQSALDAGSYGQLAARSDYSAFPRRGRDSGNRCGCARLDFRGGLLGRESPLRSRSAWTCDLS